MSDSDAAVVTFTFTFAWSLVIRCVFHRSKIYYLIKVLGAARVIKFYFIYACLRPRSSNNKSLICEIQCVISDQAKVKVKVTTAASESLTHTPAAAAAVRRVITTINYLYIDSY